MTIWIGVQTDKSTSACELFTAKLDSTSFKMHVFTNLFRKVCLESPGCIQEVLSGIIKSVYTKYGQSD